jgi:hypothetical protein
MESAFTSPPSPAIGGGAANHKKIYRLSQIRLSTKQFFQNIGTYDNQKCQSQECPGDGPHDEIKRIAV